MFSLWDLLVNQIAGSFYISVILVMSIFAIILAMGGVSFFSTLLFSTVFLFAMFLGYHHPLIVVIVGAGIIGYFVIQMIQFGERAGG